MKESYIKCYNCEYLNNSRYDSCINCGYYKLNEDGEHIIYGTIFKEIKKDSVGCKYCGKDLGENAMEEGFSKCIEIGEECLDNLNERNKYGYWSKEIIEVLR